MVYIITPTQKLYTLFIGNIELIKKPIKTILNGAKLIDNMFFQNSAICSPITLL